MQVDSDCVGRIIGIGFNSFAFVCTSSVLNFNVLLGFIHSGCELFVLFLTNVVPTFLYLGDTVNSTGLVEVSVHSTWNNWRPSSSVLTWSDISLFFCLSFTIPLFTQFCSTDQRLCQ